MIGKKLKGKINGALFLVEELRKESGKEYYIILDLQNGKRYHHDRGWFEHGIMQNMEVID